MKKRILTGILVSAAIAVLTACGGAGDAKTAGAENKVEFARGTWEGTVFTNPWLNLKVTFPSDAVISTDEEIKAMMGGAQDLLTDSGNITEQAAELSQQLSVVDLMVTLADQSTSFQMIYENTALATKGKGISAEDYLKNVETSLLQVEMMEYESSPIETVEIAGETYTKLSVTAAGGIMNQDYYCLEKKDDTRIASIIVSYLPENKSVVDEILNSIEAVTADKKAE